MPSRDEASKTLSASTPASSGRPDARKHHGPAIGLPRLDPGAADAPATLAAPANPSPDGSDGVPAAADGGATGPVIYGWVHDSRGAPVSGAQVLVMPAG